MASPTAPTIDAAGISAPSYASILSYLQGKYRSIFGNDVYLGADSQDGQFLAIVTAAINDSNAAAVAVYNSFSPATGQGNGLSSNVKINGLKRAIASNSSVNLLITGVAGTTITNGIASDANNNQWLLPASVVIPVGGSITVTATCAKLGAITAGANTVNKIQTPTLGWQSVNNAATATPGNPVESDAALRVRQSASVALSSLTVLAGILGAVEAVPGVTQARAYENDANSTDANGLPAHSISIVAQGGDATAIATAIMQKKTPGAYTYGTTVINVADSVGITHPIRFYTPTDAPITVAITIKALAGYTTADGVAIKQAITDYINSTHIGGGNAACVEWDYSIAAAKSVGATFKIVSLALTGPRGAGTPDVAILFNEKASGTTAGVTLTVT